MGECGRASVPSEALRACAGDDRQRARQRGLEYLVTIRVRDEEVAGSVIHQRGRKKQRGATLRTYLRIHFRTGTGQVHEKSED